MPNSSALSALSIRLEDAEQLLSIHEDQTGTSRGRRWGVNALNRSSVMLAVAAWEGFIEDLLRESSNLISVNTQNAMQVPDVVKYQVIQKLYDSGKMETNTVNARNRIWEFSDNGWRQVYRGFCEGKISSLNTPNVKNVNSIFNGLIGINEISKAWRHNARLTAEVYETKLDELLDLRHKVAHGALGNQQVQKHEARDGISLLRRLGERTDGAVDDYLNTKFGFSFPPPRNP